MEENQFKNKFDHILELSTEYFRIIFFKCTKCRAKFGSQEDSKPYVLGKQGAKQEGYLQFKCKYLAIHTIIVSKITCSHFYTNLVQKSYVYIWVGIKFQNLFALCNGNGSS